MYVLLNIEGSAATFISQSVPHFDLSVGELFFQSFRGDPKEKPLVCTFTSDHWYLLTMLICTIISIGPLPRAWVTQD